MLIYNYISGNKETVLKNIENASREELEAAIEECGMFYQSTQVRSGLREAAAVLTKTNYPGVFKILIEKIRHEKLSESLLCVSGHFGLTALHLSARFHDAESFAAFLGRVKVEHILHLSNNRIIKHHGCSLVHLVFLHQSMVNFIFFLAKIGYHLDLNRYSIYGEAVKLSYAEKLKAHSLYDSMARKQNVVFELPNQFFSSLKLNRSELLRVRPLEHNQQLELDKAQLIKDLIQHNETKKLHDLLSKGENLTLRNIAGFTAWEIALDARQINLFVVFMLIQSGVDPNQLRRDGQSLLHIAIFNQWPLDVIKVLIILGLDVNVKNAFGRNTLGTLLNQGYKETAWYQKIYEARRFIPNFSEEYAEFLIEKGADINSMNHQGKTWYQLASEYKDTQRMSKLNDMVLANSVICQQLNNAAHCHVVGDEFLKANNLDEPPSYIEHLSSVRFSVAAAAASSSAVVEEHLQQNDRYALFNNANAVNANEANRSAQAAIYESYPNSSLVDEANMASEDPFQNVVYGPMPNPAWGYHSEEVLGAEVAQNSVSDAARAADISMALGAAHTTQVNHQLDALSFLETDKLENKLSLTFKK